MTDRILDLDAARAARAERRGPPPLVRLGGEEFELPAELPAEYGWLLIEDETKKALELLLGSRFDEFWRLMSRDDVMAFAEGIPRLYGFASEGESSASLGSSENGSNHSRPISSGSTTSTSEPSAMAKSGSD